MTLGTIVNRLTMHMVADSALQIAPVPGVRIAVPVEVLREFGNRFVIPMAGKTLIHRDFQFG